MVVLEADVLSVVLQYVDTLDDTSPRHHIQHVVQIRGGAECRRVSRGWRTSVEDAIGRALPPMPSVSLASLLVPGRLRFVLLSCRYNHLGEGVDRAYDALVSRAEAVGVQLRDATAAAAAAAAAAAVQKTSSPSSSREQDGSRVSPAECRHYSCYRVALKRIVGEVLDSPAFAWCSTLDPDDSRLLRGCVGALALLKACWFSE
ncbi:unnamed protein product [Pylaiella littoralis]